MLKNKYLKQWSCIVSEHLPHLSIPQAIGLATQSFGLVMTKSSSLTQVSRLIAAVNQEKPNTVRQRLKEWYQSWKAKKGEKRSTLEVSSCFAPLLIWVISLLPINIEPTFRTLVVEIKSCSSPCIVRLLAITKNYEVSHSSQRSPA